MLQHRYLELLDDSLKPAGATAKKAGVTYAQLAASDHDDYDDDDDDEDSKGRRGKYDRHGRLRRNHMSPPKEQAPPPPGSSGRFHFTPGGGPDTRRKSSGPADLAGLGTNHWPQTNIPALPLPPPRESKFLRDPQSARPRREGKRRSSSLNARPLRRERERAEAAINHDDDDAGAGGARLYPTRAELRKNPFVEDVGGRAGARGRGRGRGATRSQSAGRQDARSRRAEKMTESDL
jgi:hypothetical protein